MGHRSGYFIATRSDKSSYFKGGQRVNVTSVSSNYTIREGDYIIAADTSSSALTITIPENLVAKKGYVIIVDDAGGNAGAHNITITTAGSEQIDGSGSTTISTNYASLALYSDGSNWYSF